MSQEEIFINGDLLRLRREASGWVLNDLATRACMSVKQIRQLEEGGLSSYYSQAVKITAAKKVGALLGLSPDEVLTPPSELSLAEIQIEPAVFSSDLEIIQTADIAPTKDELEVPHAFEESVDISIVSSDADAHKPSVDDEPKKSKTSLWLIAALFISALLVAAYMQPQDEPVVEAAPPIQALPADMADPAASAASGADVPASSAEPVVLSASAPAAVGVVAVNVQKQASSALGVSSAQRVAAPLATGVAPVTARPASTSTTTTPAASAASKAL
jgi:transcriptional regulator with XRE-family HTH domain